jgi:hypothetical protein
MKKLISLIFLLQLSIIASAQYFDDNRQSGMYLSSGVGFIENVGAVTFNAGAKVNHLSLTLAPVFVLNSGYTNKPFVIANVDLGYHVGNFLRVFGSYGWHAQGKQAMLDDPRATRGFKYGYGFTLYKKMTWSKDFSSTSIFLTLQKSDRFIIPSIGFYKVL